MAPIPRMTEGMAADIPCPVCKRKKLRMPYPWTWGRKFICDACGADGHAQLEGTGVPYFCCVMMSGKLIQREDWARVGAALAEGTPTGTDARSKE